MSANQGQAELAGEGSPKRAGWPETAVRAILIVVGSAQVLTALLRVVDPGLFFDEIGPFGVQNDHYIRDTAAFEGSTGVIALIAAFKPTWRIPTLAVLSLQYVTHAISHVVDSTDGCTM